MKKEHYSSLKQFLHFTYFNDGQNNSAKQVVQFFNWIEENEKLINKKNHLGNLQRYIFETKAMAEQEMLSTTFLDDTIHKNGTKKTKI